jgi:FKBP-type peptidyl-prolyl cis-trans isomerase SlyD
LTAFPEDFEFKVGATVYGENSQGQKIIAKINQLNDSGVVLDFNHPMAGKNLNFEIEIENIQE